MRTVAVSLQHWARADEVASVRIADLSLGHVPGRDPSSVLIDGKGNKSRRCPLWASTVTEILPLVSNRVPTANVFLNRRGLPLTRFGIHSLVEPGVKYWAYFP